MWLPFQHPPLVPHSIAPLSRGLLLSWMLGVARVSGAAGDAALPLAGLSDGFTGKAPDLGAYEFGVPLPHYGPRPDPHP